MLASGYLVLDMKVKLALARSNVWVVVASFVSHVSTLGYTIPAICAMRHTVPIVDPMHNIRHVLTLNVLKINVRTAVINLASIVIGSCAKGVITILSTA